MHLVIMGSGRANPSLIFEGGALGLGGKGAAPPRVVERGSLVIFIVKKGGFLWPHHRTHCHHLV